MEEAPENGKESSNSAHANGMNEYTDKNESVLHLSNQQAKKNKQRHHAKHTITKCSKYLISGAQRK